MLVAGGGGGPADPIPGDPYQLQQLAAQLQTLALGLEDAVLQLSAIEAGSWKGPAGDAFNSVIKQQPGRYADAGTAFSIAASAVASYAVALTDAQSVAMQAQGLSEQGQIATSNWESAAQTAGKTPSGTDPGAADTQQAAQMMSQVREALAQAATATITMLKEAESGAPQKPSLWDEITGDAWSAFTAPFKFTGNVLIGFGKGVWGMADGLYQLGMLINDETNPLMQLIDPGAVQKANAEFAALGQAISKHPGTFFKDLGENLVDWNQWTHNPGQALGELLPGIVLAVASGGSGAVAEGLGDAGDAATAGAKTADALSSILGATGESTLEGARGLTLLNTAMEDGLPEGALKSLVQTSNMADEASLYDQAASQLAAAGHLSETASSLRETAKILSEAKEPFENLEKATSTLNRLATASGSSSATLGSAQQANGTGSGDPGQHVIDGEGSTLGAGKGAEHVAKPSHITVQTPGGGTDFDLGGE